MVFVLRPTPLAERCFLCELLYWVALNRLPLSIGHPKERNDELRFSDWCDIDTSSFIEKPATYEECKLAGLPPNPRFRALVEGIPIPEDEYLNVLEIQIGRAADEDRDYFLQRRDDLVKERREISDWDNRFNDHLEYLGSKIF
jgi:hypothetical protein